MSKTAHTCMHTVYFIFDFLINYQLKKVRLNFIVIVQLVSRAREIARSLRGRCRWYSSDRRRILIYSVLTVPCICCRPLMLTECLLCFHNLWWNSGRTSGNIRARHCMINELMNLGSQKVHMDRLECMQHTRRLRICRHTTNQTSHTCRRKLQCGQDTLHCT